MTQTSQAPLIEVEDKQPDEQIMARLRPELARELRAYGEYAQNSSTSHVISAALKRLFRDDKGFKAFKESNPSAGDLQTDSSRRGRPKASKPEKAKAPAA